MKVAFLVIGGSEVASSRYRVLQYLPFLQEAGIEAKITVIPKGTVERWHFFRTLRDYDITFIQKKLFQPWELAYIRSKALRLVYDLDDAVMYKPSGDHSRISFSRWMKFRQMVLKSDLIIAGNSYLMEEAKKYNHKVEILPTVLDSHLYRPVWERPVRNKTVIGWIGSRSNLRYLLNIQEVLDELYDRYQGLELKIVADDFINLEKMPVIKKEWKEEDEAADLQSFDIGLMPLPDDPWTRGKCGFKLLQYMAAGLPVVSSPVGVNQEIVKDGYNGFLANSKEEWYLRLSTLISDVALRKIMGQRGREILEEKYSLHQAAPRFIELLRAVYKS